jgi:uncharacterized membrane protein
MEETLPPLANKYKDQLDVVGIDVDHEVGQNLYQAAAIQFDIPDERIGIPTLIIGDVVLVGSREIPDELPKIIDEGLVSGGIDWPNIPGLQDVLAAQPSSASAQTGTTKQVSTSDQSSTLNPSFIDKFTNDPIANSVAVVVLLGMFASVIGVGYSYVIGSKSKSLHWPKWVLPVLAVAGLGVAIYMSYIEVTQSKAICGPVGDCNSVQESPYAYLFGIIPIGIMGVIGYIAIFVSWLIQQYGPERFRKLATLVTWGMAWFGILFSIYLTFLEPFVIGATCAWCIASAIIMTLILWASTGPALESLKTDEFDEFEFDEFVEMAD